MKDTAAPQHNTTPQSHGSEQQGGRRLFVYSARSGCVVVLFTASSGPGRSGAELTRWETETWTNSKDTAPSPHNTATPPPQARIFQSSPWAVLAQGCVVGRRPGLVAHGRWNLSGCVGRVELVSGYLALGFRCEPHSLTVPLERRCNIKEKAFRRNPGNVIIHSHGFV